MAIPNPAIPFEKLLIESSLRSEELTKNVTPAAVITGIMFIAGRYLR
ncbi:MAG TPA: hypothetical protein VFE50_23165 [Cyclobacteriaceae bacterium]|nr:hypothetical protein [Cyclobacteriaceae bacterium]